MDCNIYSEDECMKSNDCFLCTNGNYSKCIHKSSNDKKFCELANPYNYYDYDYIGNIKSRDEFTKQLDETHNNKNNSYDFIEFLGLKNIFNFIIEQKEDLQYNAIGTILIIIGVFVYMTNQV